MAIAEFLLTVEQQPDQRPVDVAKTEQAEVVSVNSDLLDRDVGGSRRDAGATRT